MNIIRPAIKVGNSFGITIPAEFAKKNNIQQGTPIAADLSLPRSTEYDRVSDTEFLKTIQEVESRYGEALDELAHLP